MNNDEISHKHILEQVQANSKAIADIHDEAKILRKELEPVREFISDIDTAARFGRGLRGLVGWVVIVGGFVAMIYIVVVDSIKA